MQKFILLIDGPMGSGKTTVANLIHTKIHNTAWIGLDRIKWLVSGFRRSKKQNEMTRNVVEAMAEEYARQGVNIIVEQGFCLEHVAFFRKLAKKNHAAFYLFELAAPKEVLLRRIKERMAQRVKTRTVGKPVVMSRIMRNLKIHMDKKKDPQARLIETVGLMPEQIAGKIIKEIRK
jgi:predicted kinase